MTTNYRNNSRSPRANGITSATNSYPTALVISEVNTSLIKEANLVCLRNKHTGRVENVSFTEQGLV